MIMKRIVGIGGAVIKTAQDELMQLAERKEFDILIHNGASLFHDFQIARDGDLWWGGKTSYSLEEIYNNPHLITRASMLVWEYLEQGCSINVAPIGSVTRVCKRNNIEVLLAVGLGLDFWQLHGDWSLIAKVCKRDYTSLVYDMMLGEFEFLNVGSAVTMPELFTKARFEARPKEFRTLVVDFKDMYRPRTRLGEWGPYLQIEIKDFLRRWLDYGSSYIDEIFQEWKEGNSRSRCK